MDERRRTLFRDWMRRLFLAVGMTGILAGPVTAGFTEGEILSGACGGRHGHTGVSRAGTITAGQPCRRGCASKLEK